MLCGRRNPLKALGSVASILASVIFYRTNDTDKDALSYTEPTLKQDAVHSVDLIVRVTTSRLNAPLTFLIQERFRRPEVARFNNVTISEWLANSNRPAELYSIKAQPFCFGRYDESTDTMIESVLFWVHPTLHAIASGSIP